MFSDESQFTRTLTYIVTEMYIRKVFYLEFKKQFQVQLSIESPF